MNESSQRHSVVVGIFVVVGLAILVSGVLLLGNLNRSLKKKIEVSAFFNDVNGLQKGNFIWFTGVRIGTVSSIRLTATRGVEVNMEIDSKVKQYIHKDSRVKLGSDGLIGNRILVIFGGTPGSGTINDGDTLSFEKGLSTDDLMATLQESNENLKSITGDFRIVIKKLANGEGSAGKLLNDDGLYTNLNAATASLRDASLKASKLLGSLADYSAGLKKEGTLAYELTSDTMLFRTVRTSITKLSQIADTAGILVSRLKQSASNENTPAGVLLNNEKTGADLQQTIANLKVSTEKLNEDLEGLQHSWPMKRYFRKKEGSK
ncbi:MAG TPA: MlaD family protein [Bacteroidales bacterium]|nr:MlaD family protein [Bacteroidales bacterium]